MAIYSLPPLVNRISGSRKGITIQKAGTNFIIRKRAVLVQKRSVKQSFAKSLLASRSQGWRTLSAAQQATWLAQVGNYTRVDSLGNVYNILATPLQTGTNINAELNSSAPLTSGSPPVVYPARSFQFIDFNSLAPTAIAQMTDLAAPFSQLVPAGFSAKLFMSSPGYATGEQVPIVNMKLIRVYQELENTALTNIWFDYAAQYPVNPSLFLTRVQGAFVLTSLSNFFDGDPFFTVDGGLYE